MKYSSGQSFRQGLESHIFALYQQTGIPISRYRKVICFDRFLARLITVGDDQFVIKGGFMMELIFHQLARATKDIDFLFRGSTTEVYRQLYRASKIDLGDWFQFEVAQPEGNTPEFGMTVRYNVIARVDSRKFDEFHIDISTSDILVNKPEMIESVDFLNFAGIERVKIPCYSITQQIAEKFHALTRTYLSGDPSRMKDLIDILLIANTCSIKSADLLRCVQFTFEHRATHKIPDTIPQINEIYSKSYHSLASKAGLKQKSLSEGNSAFSLFLTPIIEKNTYLVWNPILFQWEKVIGK